MGQEQLWQGGPWERPRQAVKPLVLPQVRPAKKRRNWIVFWIFLLVIVLLTAVAWCCAGWTEQLSGSGPVQTSIPRAGVGGGARLELEDRAEQVLTAREVYDACIAGVVYIQAKSDAGIISSGSGVVMSSDGYIITNAHVIAGASSVRVVFRDNRALEAGLVGMQEDYDLAVLKVEADGLATARFCSSAHLRVGDEVVAIGNPLGSTLRGTMTQGIVSAINRSVDLDGTTMSLVQTTAALNPGNSGGALINDRGQVVGITTMKMMSRYETIEGLGFAIPSRLVKGVVNQLIATGQAKTPALGITVAFDLAEYGGLKVLKVEENSDAWAKGLRPSDVIVAVNEVPMTDDSVLVAMKEELGVGESLTLTVDREGGRLELEVLLMDAALFEEES